MTKLAHQKRVPLPFMYKWRPHPLAETELRDYWEPTPEPITLEQSLRELGLREVVPEDSDENCHNRQLQQV